MKTSLIASTVLIAVALLTGCDAENKKTIKFVLPDGDVVRGQKSFVDLKCYECHRVDGVAGLPSPAVAPEEVVRLGGEVANTRSYGDLVTAIIHPSLERTVQTTPNMEDPLEMPDSNETMTVSQMLDIVTFLHSHYHRLKPLYYDDYYGP